MEAIVKQVTRGKMKGQYRFVLKGDNGEIIATSETYTQEHNVLEVLYQYFPTFKIKIQKPKIKDESKRG